MPESRLIPKNPALERMLAKHREIRPELDLWRYRFGSTLLVASTALLVLVIGQLPCTVGTNCSRVLRLLVVLLSSLQVLATTTYLYTLLTVRKDSYDNELTAALKSTEGSDAQTTLLQCRNRLVKAFGLPMQENLIFLLFACEVVALTSYGVYAIVLA